MTVVSSVGFPPRRTIIVRVPCIMTVPLRGSHRAQRSGFGRARTLHLSADVGTRTADGRQVTQLVVTPELEEHPRTLSSTLLPWILPCTVIVSPGDTGLMNVCEVQPQWNQSTPNSPPATATGSPST